MSELRSEVIMTQVDNHFFFIYFVITKTKPYRIGVYVDVGANQNTLHYQYKTIS